MCSYSNLLTTSSVSGAIWNNILPKKLANYLPTDSKKLAMPIYKSIVKAQEAAKGTAIRAATDQAYRETQRLLAIAATAALAPMLIVMFALKTIDLTNVDAAKDADNRSVEEVDNQNTTEPVVKNEK